MHAILLADLSYGDTGKGTITDFLARKYKAHTVVRYNGGAQAGHNVVLSDGREHTFAQFGSATFVPGVRTYLSKYMVVNPISMLNEEKHLQEVGVLDALERTAVSQDALVVTPYHRSINRLREMARGKNRHGSCGRGIGEAVVDSFDSSLPTLRVGDLRNEGYLRETLREILNSKRELAEQLFSETDQLMAAWKEIGNFRTDLRYYEYMGKYLLFADKVNITDESFWQETLSQEGTMIFEGAQGVLLDQVYGFHPYTTWSDVTFNNALEMLGDYKGGLTKVGITRAYATRHGAGPFVTEDAVLTRNIQDVHNTTNDWQQGFRVGWFDKLTTKYAIQVLGGVDYLAVTNLDRLRGLSSWLIATAYSDPMFHIDGGKIWEYLPVNMQRDCRTEMLLSCNPLYKSIETEASSMVRAIEECMGIPAAISSIGPTAEHKILNYNLCKERMNV